MAYKSVYKGIIFIEGQEEFIQNFGPVEYKKGASLYNNQLKNLDDVKEQLAEKTRALGGNAVIYFKYGQKSTSWFKSLFLSLAEESKCDMDDLIVEAFKNKEIIEKLNN